ncbi:Uncharacterized protein GBIM_19086 [Gryllus bimaculatus]|nr:Uncharacterized protein GBIM_19086 [Gryllus bimaculatus]
MKASMLVDCAVSPWGAWSACDADCGAGMMTRSRAVERQPENGGRHCPSLVQKRGCQGTRCPHSAKSAVKGEQRRAALDGLGGPGRCGATAVPGGGGGAGGDGAFEQKREM